jgi:prepilin-type N-terminal cleavage/methylation domain-containing protein
MKRERATRDGGFTLIETVVSLGLFGLAAATMYGLLVAQMRLEATNATTTQAISLAATELEYLRSLDYPNIPATHTTTTIIDGLTYTVRSTAVFDSPAPSMASITTTVSWTEPLGPDSYTVDAIYTDVTR